MTIAEFSPTPKNASPAQMRMSKNIPDESYPIFVHGIDSRRAKTYFSPVKSTIITCPPPSTPNFV
jgi:hypothetical protein